MDPETTQIKNLNGIRGWLILTVISLIITPIISLLYVLFELTTYFEPDYWYSITTYGSEIYHPLFAPMIIYELALNLALILIPILLLFLMFKRSRYFPKAMIIYLLCGVVFHFVDVYLGYRVFSNVAEIEGTLGELEYILFKDTSRIVISALIWVPYFVYSKRVKATFLGSKNSISEVAITNELNKTNTIESSNNQHSSKKTWLPILSYIVNGLLAISIIFIWYYNNDERKGLEHSNSVLSQENTELEELNEEIKKELSNKETNNLTYEEEKDRLLNDINTLQEENTSLLNDVNTLQDENTRLQNNLNSLQEKSVAQKTAEPKKTSDTDLIDIGSTQEDVKRIMGTPSSIQDYGGFFSVWNYGSSTIRFDENGKVEGWRDYDNNLKLK